MKYLRQKGKGKFDRLLLFVGIKGIWMVMTVQWTHSHTPLAYEQALADMEELVSAIIKGDKCEQVWLLEHPPLYTAGTSAKATDLLNPQFPVYDTGRGGEYTYHGPGQRVAYVMLNLEKRKMKDLRLYIAKLEQWIIDALTELGVKGGRRDGRIGIWVDMDDPFIESRGKVINTGATAPAPFGAAFPPEAETRKAGSFHKKLEMTRPIKNEKKIAAIGVRVRKWVTFHGVSINVNPDLSHFEGIVPCGIREYGVTSLAEIIPDVTMADLDDALKKAWHNIFL